MGLPDRQTRGDHECQCKPQDGFHPVANSRADISYVTSPVLPGGEERQDEIHEPHDHSHIPEDEPGGELVGFVA